jgi:tetratricopeptide (TPR) repeat protein
MPGFLRRMFDRLRALFSRKPVARRMSIPAPSTLVGRIERLEDEDRELLRIAEEALRRGFPQQAHVAYWKAARFYLGREQYVKAISVLGQILRLAPNDIEAWIARGDCCAAIDRRRDAARAYFEAGCFFEAHQDINNALALFERCIALDKDLEGLQLRYLRLGGSTDPWTHDLPPNAPDAPSEPALEEMEMPGTPIEAIPAAITDPAGRDSNSGEIELDLGPIEKPQAPRPMTRPPVRFAIPNQATTADVGIPSALVGSEHEAIATGDLGAEIAAATRDDDVSAKTEAMGIPAQSAPIADAKTEAVDANMLARLLKKSKGAA